MSAQDDLQQLADYVMSLPPDQQAQAMSDLGLMSANQVPYSYEGAFQPELDAASLEGAQYPGSYNIPQLTAKGKVDPRDLTQVKQSTDLAKDREGLLADKVFAMQAGPGAYGAGVFDPTIEYKGNTVDFPGERTLQAFAQTKGWQGFMAKRMLGQTSTGVRESPSEAWASLQAFMDSPKADPAEVKTLKSSLLPSSGNQSGTTGPGITIEGATVSPTTDASVSPYNIAGMQAWANDMYTGLLKDRPKDSLFQDPKTGQYYDQAPDTTESTQAKWFHDQGYDLPTDSYADPIYQDKILNQADPNRLANNQQAALDYDQGQQTVDAAKGVLDQVGGNYDALLQAAYKEQQQRNGFVNSARDAIGPDTTAPAPPRSMNYFGEGRGVPKPLPAGATLPLDRQAAAFQELVGSQSGQQQQPQQPDEAGMAQGLSQLLAGRQPINQQLGTGQAPGTPPARLTLPRGNGEVTTAPSWWQDGAPAAAQPTAAIQPPANDMAGWAVAHPQEWAQYLTGVRDQQSAGDQAWSQQQDWTGQGLGGPAPAPSTMRPPLDTPAPIVHQPTNAALGNAYDQQYSPSSMVAGNNISQVPQYSGNQRSNEMMQSLLNALGAQSGQTQGFDFTYGGTKTKDAAGNETTTGAKTGRVEPKGRLIPTASKDLQTAAGKQFRAARDQYTKAYGNQFTQGMATGGGQSANYLDEYRQRLKMESLAKQGRTPLMDEQMQRRLLLNSMGLYS